MICPKCGSRDVIDWREIIKGKGIAHAECQRCTNEWVDEYDPFPIFDKDKKKGKHQM